MIQIGNEVRSACFGIRPGGRMGVAMEYHLAMELFLPPALTGFKGCREVCPDAWVMIHSDRGGDEVSAVRFFIQMQIYNVDYDIIGISYYPFWHGPLTQLKIAWMACG